MHWITRRLCSVRHPSASCSKCLTFCTFEIWEIWHFCVKVSNIAKNFVLKRCKYKYWIAFCRCSRAIWIASERIAYAVHLIYYSFRCNSYGPWTPTKCDSMLKQMQVCLFLIDSNFELRSTVDRVYAWTTNGKRLKKTQEAEGDNFDT